MKRSEATSEPPKVVRDWCVLYILTSKCASRHNGVHFFDISTSKSGPNVVCFVHFHFEMCFAPQRRALFWHLNFQKWSDPGVCLYILTWKSASRHNGVQFFITHLASWLRTGRFSEPTFSTLRSHKSLEKHSVSRLYYLFAHLHLLSSYSFSSTLLSSNLSLLSASSLLCFSSVHIVGSLTSKLPSIMEDPINIDDLWVPPFQETSICWLTFPLYRKLAKRSKKDAGLLSLFGGCWNTAGLKNDPCSTPCLNIGASYCYQLRIYRLPGYCDYLLILPVNKVL